MGKGRVRGTLYSKMAAMKPPKIPERVNTDFGYTFESESESESELGSGLGSKSNSKSEPDAGPDTVAPP